MSTLCCEKSRSLYKCRSYLSTKSNKSRRMREDLQLNIMLEQPCRRYVELHLLRAMHLLSADSLPGDQILLTITGILLMYLSEILFLSQDIKTWAAWSSLSAFDPILTVSIYINNLSAKIYQQIYG